MLEHGGNLAIAAQQYGIPLAAWLDLSTGINPQHYPIPNIPGSAWQRLPEDNEGLIEAACAYYGCQSALATAGSQLALQVLPQLRAPCKVLMPSQMYQEHAHAWLQHGHEVIFFDDMPNIKQLNQADVLLLCNPNNPTGMCFSKYQLLQWHTQLASRGGWLVVDEAFMDASPENSVAAHAHLQGLFVLRSLGKFFGLAGARVGFLLANRIYLQLAQEIIGPWPLAGPSRFIAKQALLDSTWQAKMRQQLASNSEQLKQLLTQYGLCPNGGTALFQTAKTPQAGCIQQALAKHGVWVRLFAESNALRFGLPPDGGWQQLEQALELEQHLMG